MIRINFYLKAGSAEKAKKKKERPIVANVTFTYTRIDGEGGKARKITERVLMGTGEELSPEHWNDRKQAVKETYRNFAQYQTKLDEFKKNVAKACEDIVKEGFYSEGGKLITGEKIRDRIARKFEAAAEAAKNTPDVLFVKAWEEFIEIQTEFKGPRTIQKYKTTLANLQEYEKHQKRKLTFDNIDPQFYETYRAWLLKRGNGRASKQRLLDDTISKYIAVIKTFMKWAYERKMHTNDAFTRFKAPSKSKVENVSLTETELLSIQALDLTGNSRLERVRDLFVFACYTGQRWGDVQAFSKEDIRGNVWRLENKKTRKYVSIPLDTFAAPARAILEKYEYQLPKISDVKFNKYIKEVGQLAGINEPIKLKRYSGNKPVTVEKPKYELISSHMARRTFITILLGKGVPSTLIMKFTAHADLRTLMRYEHSQEEAAFEALRNVGQLGQSAIRKAV